jgi:hypothetical protein
MTAVKKACDDCHQAEKYRDKYKDEMRDSPFGG